MILQSCGVELTKVHYYDPSRSGRNAQVFTISRNAGALRQARRHAIIKKNVFGRKWVLKINESADDPKKSKAKRVAYALVFACILVAVGFGIFLSIDTTYFSKKTSPKETTVQVPTPKINTSNESALNLSILYNSNASRPSSRLKENAELSSNSSKGEAFKSIAAYIGFCRHCNRSGEICLKVVETERPKCRKIIDRKDPTGCGGLCKVNQEYCRLLDAHEMLFQCRALRNQLNCSKDLFNCGNRCISNRLRCDGIFHCSDWTDEVNCECDLETHFQCGNSTGCLENKKRCDGKVDCWDNSDETNCNRLCINGQVPCHSGHCISQAHFCDGVFHCPDKSDEPKGCELQK